MGLPYVPTLTPKAPDVGWGEKLRQEPTHLGLGIGFLQVDGLGRLTRYWRVLHVDPFDPGAKKERLRG